MGSDHLSRVSIVRCSKRTLDVLDRVSGEERCEVEDVDEEPPAQISRRVARGGKNLGWEKRGTCFA
jgi:hypothetical protein